jgi:hypothetical protein
MNMSKTNKNEKTAEADLTLAVEGMRRQSYQTAYEAFLKTTTDLQNRAAEMLVITLENLK